MQDQVKTDTGYNYGGTSYKNEERTNSQGQKYTVAIPVSSVTTAPQPQFQTPAPQAPTNYNAMTSDIATPYDAIVENRNLGQNQEATDLSNLMNTLSGKSAFESQQNEATGLNAANQAAIQKSAEISALGKQAAAAQQENISQGRQLGSVSSFVAGQGAEIERNRAIKALSLGAELDAIQGNIAVAQSKVKQAVDAEYADKEQLLANKLKMFDINDKITQNLSSARKEALANARYNVEKEQKRLEVEKKDKEDVQNMIIEATPNAPASVVANAKKLAESGASKLAVAQALGVYGGDYLKNELLKEQLKTERKQRENIQSQINARATPTVLGKDGVVATLPKAAQDRYYKLQGDFDTATKSYRGAIDAAGSVKALSQNATAQDQTAIIFQYMKTLDPNSTVREGEFALVAATAGLGDRAVNAIKRLDNGQRLNEAQIKDIVGATDKLAANAKANLEATSKEYDRRASIGGLPSGLFLEKTQTTPDEDYADSALKALESSSSYKQSSQTFLQSLIGQ